MHSLEHQRYQLVVGDLQAQAPALNKG